ncbi:MAG TPA: aspartyl protease family protein [Sphingomonas sp.]
MAMLRLSSVLVPLLLAAAPATPRDGVATLSADAEARWVPFDLTPGNQIRFPMTLDGKPIVAVLDTGVSYSVLAAASAATIPARVVKGGTATAIGGKVTIGWMPTTELTIGGLTRRGGRVAVAPLPAAATGSADAVDMLVGRDVTGAQALDIDFAARRFRLLPSGRMPFVGTVAPLSISARRQIYESAITLAGRRLSPMVVDTGDGAAVTLSAASWRATAPHDARTTTTISFGLAGSTISTLTIVPTLTIGGLTARQTELRVEPAGGFSDGIGVAGRIGSGFLQRYRVLLDPAAGRMVLQPGPTADRSPLRSTSGLLVRVETDRLRVLHVMRGSPAAETGWRDDDQICAVDGSPIAAAYTGSHVAAWSIGEPGRIVALRLCDGSVRSLTLKHFY